MTPTRMTTMTSRQSAEPESMFPESTEFKSTRPPGSGDLPQDPTGHSYSGSAPLLDGASTTGTGINSVAALPARNPNGQPAMRIARSLPRQRWLLAESHPEQAAALAQDARIPLVLADLLLARGITTAGEAFTFLNPELEHLHDPFLMLGMDRAVARLEQANAARAPIRLNGDSDVDGTVAVVLLKTAIEMLGGTISFHVPHRLREGYGMQSSVLEAAHAEGVRVVVTVDTGMRSFAEAETARKLGLDLLVTDHHLADAHDRIPDALAILNPNQPGCAYPEKSLCGAAIAFKLAQALLERHDASRMHEKFCPVFSRWLPSPPLPTPSRCAAKIAPSRRLGFVSCAAPSAQACALSSPRPRSTRRRSN